MGLGLEVFRCARKAALRGQRQVEDLHRFTEAFRAVLRTGAKCFSRIGQRQTFRDF